MFVVVIKSCQKYADRRQAQLDTWLPDLKAPYFFVVGDIHPTPHMLDNVFHFPVSDAFPNIAPKLRCGLSLALDYGADSIFVCDDDTYVRPERLVPPDGDYVGWFRHDGGYGYPLPYIQGCAYWLSQRAAIMAVQSGQMVDGVPDDVAVGRALYGKVPFIHDPSYEVGPKPERIPLPDNWVVSAHKALPDAMRDIDKQWRAYA